MDNNAAIVAKLIAEFRSELALLERQADRQLKFIATLASDESLRTFDRIQRVIASKMALENLEKERTIIAARLFSLKLVETTIAQEATAQVGG